MFSSYFLFIPLLIYSDMRLAHAVDGLQLSTDTGCRNFFKTSTLLSNLAVLFSD